MGAVLLRALSFAFIIAVGIFLKEKNLVGPDAGKTVQMLMINVTLPAAIICNFASLERMTAEMAIMPIIGAGIAFGLMLITMLIMRNASRDDKISFCNVIPGINIGNFCLPFVQSFFPAAGSVALCLYDVGNSVFCLGGGYASISAYAGGAEHKFSLKHFIKTLLSSLPLDIYLLLFFLSLVGVRPPQAVADFVQPIADANAFVAMAMLGLTFHLELKKEYVKKIILLLGSRYVAAGLVSLAVWFFLPVDTLIKQVIIMTVFGPVNTVAGAYTGMCKGDEGLVSCVTSLSIPCSIIALTCILLGFGIF